MKPGPVNKRKSTRHMNDSAFSELRESARQALEHARGERADLRVTRVPFPSAPRSISSARVISIRRRLNFSQRMFARLLNVSPRTIQDWEQGRRTPSDAALKLLMVAERHPDVLLEG
jgi:putative transcriptional regulator